MMGVGISIMFGKYDVPLPCAVVKREASDVDMQELAIAERMYGWSQLAWCASGLKKEFLLRPHYTP